MTTSTPKTFEQWLRTQYPPPAEGEPGYGFFQSFGYDQWLIKTQKKDTEQLAILMRPQYMQYVLATVLSARLAMGAVGVEALVGLPLVRSLKALQQFPFVSVARGVVGVSLQSDGKDALVCLPAGRNIFTDFVPLSAIEDLGAVMTTADDMVLRQEGLHPATPNVLAETFCTVPGLNGEQPIWVGKVFSNSIGNPWHVDMLWAPAATFAKADGTYKVPAAKYMGDKLTGKQYWNPPEPMQRTHFAWNDADRERLETANVIAVIQDGKVVILAKVEIE